MAVNAHGLSWWESEPGDPQWLAVDLGARQPINRVRVFAKDNVKTFKIQVSDDATQWSDVAAHIHPTRIGSGEVKTIFDVRFASEVQTRHVRFYGTGREKPEHGYSIVQLVVLRDHVPSRPPSNSISSHE